MLHCTRGEEDACPFTSHYGVVRFGCACAIGQREKACCRRATGVASLPERRSERLAGFRPSASTGHPHVVVDERHIHHFGAFGGLRRGAGFYDSEAFSIDHLYRHSHGSGGSAHASAKVNITPTPRPAADQKPSQEEIPSDQRQMRGLDEQIQEIKSDALRMSAELSQLEEKLLYPSGTQVAIFVELAKGDTLRLDAVRLQIDGQLVAHYIYSAKELQALRKGGVQRIYVGNVATGDHKLEVLVDGKLEGGTDFSRTGEFTFRKEVKPKLVGLTLAGPRSGNTPIALGEW